MHPFSILLSAAATVSASAVDYESAVMSNRSCARKTPIYAGIKAIRYECRRSSSGVQRGCRSSSLCSASIATRDFASGSDCSWNGCHISSHSSSPVLDITRCGTTDPARDCSVVLLLTPSIRCSGVGTASGDTLEMLCAELPRDGATAPEPRRFPRVIPHVDGDYSARSRRSWRRRLHGSGDLRG